MSLRPTMRWLPAIAIASLIIASGCGGAATFKAPAPGAASEADVVRAARDGVVAKNDLKPAGNAGQAVAGAAAPKAPPDDVQRKIIYTAQVEVVVKDLDPAMAEVAKLAGQNKAYVSASEVRGNMGYARTAAYTIRVPVENFRKLKDALLTLGVPERDQIKSDDLTEEFFDLQARLKVLRSSQDRLIELKKAASVKEILEIEPQLERVTEKIEQVEGRLKYINTFAALSTINLSLREVKDYKPPTAPSFGGRIGTVFGNSWEALVTFGENVVLLLVALTPWLPVLVPLGLLGLWVLRKLIRMAARPAEHRVARPTAPPRQAPPPEEGPRPPA